MNDLIEEAHRLLEDHRYVEARTILRDVALLAPPSDSTLSNLAVAEDGERLKFRSTLITNYPGDIRVALDEIARLLDAGHSGVAMNRCNKIMSDYQLSPREMLWIRSWRLEAAKSSGAASNFIDDFLFNFRFFNESDKYYIHNLHRISKLIAQITNPALISSLKQVASEIKEPACLLRLVEAKTTELEILESIRAGFIGGADG